MLPPWGLKQGSLCVTHWYMKNSTRKFLQSSEEAQPYWCGPGLGHIGNPVPRPRCPEGSTNLGLIVTLEGKWWAKAKVMRGNLRRICAQTPHFIEGETEAQRQEVTDCRSLRQSWWNQHLGFLPTHSFCYRLLTCPLRAVSPKQTSTFHNTS